MLNSSLNPPADCRPIHLAAQNGHVRCLKRLLELGVDRDPRDKMGKTPLRWASGGGQLECVKALLDAGADIRAQSIQARLAAVPGGFRCSFGRHHPIVHPSRE